MKKENSSLLYPRAKKVMPGGVNSPVRAFNAVGGEPIFIKSAKGSSNVYFSIAILTEEMLTLVLYMLTNFSIIK